VPSIFPKFIISKKVYAFYLAVAFFFALFSFGKIAFADISQTNHSTSNTGVTQWFQSFGTGLTGSLTDIEMFSSVPAGTVNWQLTECDSSGYNQSPTGISCNGSSSNIFSIAPTAQAYGTLSYTLPSPYTFDSSKYYYTTFISASNPNQVGGITVEGFPAGSASFSPSNPSGIQDLYFVLSGIGGGSSGTSQIFTFTYSTTTRQANVTGFWSATTTTGVSERLSFWQESTLLGRESFEQITATSTGNFSFTFEFLGIPDSYTGTTTQAFIAPFSLNVSLDQYDLNYYDPFGLNGLDTSLYVMNLDATSTIVTTSSYGIQDYTTPRGLQEYPEYECSISSITGCLKNAGIWLFYPSPDSIEQFKSLPEALSGKFPFAYAFQINTLRQELVSASSTASSTIGVNVPGFGEITFISEDMVASVPFTGTVRTILGWILWLLAIEYVYYRVIRSHDSQTPA